MRATDSIYPFGNQTEFQDPGFLSENQIIRKLITSDTNQAAFTMAKNKVKGALFLLYF